MRRLRFLLSHPFPLQAMYLRVCVVWIETIPHPATARLDLLLERRPRRCPHEGGRETSQVPGGPQYHHALLYDPAEWSVPGCCGTDHAAFRSENDVGLGTNFLSGLNHMAWGLPVYASQPGSPLHHATLGSGWLPTFAGQVTSLPGPSKRFPLYYPLHNFPLLQALPGALSAETFFGYKGQ